MEVVAEREYEIKQKVIVNPLHYFASYTYSLSLALLEQQDYNDVVSKGKYTPKNVLIAGNIGTKCYGDKVGHED